MHYKDVINKDQGFFIAKMNSKKNQWKINQWKWEKNMEEIKKYRDMNMGIEKGVGNGTENEGGRLGALLSTTACSF